MNQNTTIQPLSDAEVDAVCGGGIGGVINTPISSATISTLSAGPGLMLSGQSGGTFSGGRFGFAAQSGSNLYFHNEVSRSLYFSVLRR